MRAGLCSRIKSSWAVTSRLAVCMYVCIYGGLLVRLQPRHARSKNRGGRGRENRKKAYSGAQSIRMVRDI